MANKTFYLRPCEDISAGHSLEPEGSASAANLISETETDNGFTSIFLEGDAGYAYSEFKLGFDNNTTFKKVVSAFIKVDASFGYGEGSHNIIIRDENGNEVYSIYIGYSGEVNIIGVTINGESTHPDSAWGGFPGSSITESFDASSLADFINNHIAEKGFDSPLNLTLQIHSGVRRPDGSKHNARAELSQAIFELECDVGINVREKINGIYKPATTAYQKHNGTWSEIPEDQAKTILKNNTIRRG